MKLIGYIVVIITFSFCTSEVDINKLEIRKVDFEINTVFRIGCNNFEDSFKKDVKSITITDKSRIQNFKQLLAKLKVDKENYNPDVRAKLLIYYSNSKIDTLCMSEIGILFNGKSYLANEELLNFVRDTTK